MRTVRPVLLPLPLPAPPRPQLRDLEGALTSLCLRLLNGHRNGPAALRPS